MSGFFHFLKFMFTVFFFGVIGYGGFFLFEQYIWNDQIIPRATSPSSDMEDEIGNISSVKHFDEEKSLVTDRPFAMLLLGIDTNNVKEGRSDTIILAVVDPENENVSMLSIPRDLRVKMANSEQYDKVNAAYARGGVDMTAATISDYLQIPIEYYSIINFKGFTEMVDTIGGLEVDVEKEIYFHDRITKSYFLLYPGSQTLTGIEALNYARYRSDGEGDFGRMRRQQQVIKEVIDQSVSLRNVPKLLSMLNVVGDNVDANLGFKDMATLALKMRNVRGDDIKSLPLEATPTMIGGVSYVTVSDAELLRVQNELDLLLNK
jgi:polyisoprenyl-teichoic acid--peptidoglycan teichoic acid transferase